VSGVASQLAHNPRLVEQTRQLAVAVRESGTAAALLKAAPGLKNLWVSIELQASDAHNQQETLKRILLLLVENIGELLDDDMRAHLEFTRMTGAVVRDMRLLDKPIIAAVNGVAAGAGAVIALACDLRVVARSAKFSFLFTQVGLTGADMGAAYLLPRVVGMGRAAEILMLAEEIDAATAERIGLANRVADDELLLPTALDLARKLASGPVFALSMTKRMLEREWNMDLLGALESEAQAQALAFGTTDASLPPHRRHPGNRPSSTIRIERLDARNLGRLLALYEHKVFAQGVIWNINSFDQWGVELGKALARRILAKGA